MPKVSKKAGRDEAAVLEAVPLPMETADEEQPSTSGAAPKPSFAPMSAFDQNGRRVEFRRVRGASRLHKCAWAVFSGKRQGKLCVP